MKNSSSINKDYAKVESIVNRDGDQLPFAYSSPQSNEKDGSVTWHCGYDQDKKITSVFAYINGQERDRKIAYLPDEKEAIKARDILVNNGWTKIKPPEITIKYSDGSEKPLNREQKRELGRIINKNQ